MKFVQFCKKILQFMAGNFCKIWLGNGGEWAIVGGKSVNILVIFVWKIGDQNLGNRRPLEYSVPVLCYVFWKLRYKLQLETLMLQKTNATLTQ